MNARHVLYVLLVTSALVGCDKTGRIHGGLDPEKPRIDLRDNRIVLDQEILVFPRGVSGPVTFTLPPQSPYRFPRNGIVIEGRIIDRVIRGETTSVVLDPRQDEIINCQVSQDALSFTCLNRHTVPGVYKFTIRIRSGDRVIERDPPWVNM